jgi:anti-sigma factor RsiW
MALTCRELIELLGERLSGDLAPGLRASVDAHLLGCAECTAYLRSYETTIRLAKEVSERFSPGAADAPDDLARAILSGLSKKRLLQP